MRFTMPFKKAKKSASFATESVEAVDAAMIPKTDPHLFDARWYADFYPDVIAAGADPFSHFVEYGANERRRPNALFDTDWYLRSYPDANAWNGDPLDHYVQVGHARGYDPSAMFSTDRYLADHKDVADANVNALEHYLRFGKNEKRHVAREQADSGAKLAIFLGREDAYNDHVASLVNEFVRLGLHVNLFYIDPALPDAPQGVRNLVADRVEAGTAFNFIVIVNSTFVPTGVIEMIDAPVFVILSRELDADATKNHLALAILPRTMWLTLSRGTADALAKLAPNAASRIRHWPMHLLPAAARPKVPDSPSDIAFAGEYLNTDALASALQLIAAKDSSLWQEMTDCISLSETEAGNLGNCASPKLYRALRDGGFSREAVDVLIADFFANREKIHTISAIRHHKISWFVGADWLSHFESAIPLLSTMKMSNVLMLRYGSFGMYDQSRIALVVPTPHERDSITDHMLSAMSSRALMIAPYNANSELFSFLGADAPVPMYRSLAELREICDHYLGNESERKALVEDCNARVAISSVERRSEELLIMAGVTTSGRTVGRITRHNP